MPYKYHNPNISPYPGTAPPQRAHGADGALQPAAAAAAAAAAAGRGSAAALNAADATGQGPGVKFQDMLGGSSHLVSRL